jgi:hypothetical protein
VRGTSLKLKSFCDKQRARNATLKKTFLKRENAPRPLIKVKNIFMRIIDLFKSLMGKNGFNNSGTGLIDDPVDYRDVPLSSVLGEEKVELPEEYKLPYKLTITDQGRTPHCVGHTLATIKEFFEKKEGNNITFDPAWLYNEAKKIDGIPDLKGTTFRAGLKVLLKKGAKPIESGAGEPERFRIGGYANLDDISPEGLKRAIYEKGPILIGFHGSNNGWKDEYIRPPKPGESIWGHAIALAVGWNKDYFIGQNSWGCYSDDTEILTNEGWKLFKNLNKKEKVITINPEDKRIEYQQPTNYFEYDYAGKMYYYKNSKIDLLVSPNHKILKRKHKKSSFKLAEAQKIKDNKFNSLRWGIWKGNKKNIKKVGDKEISMNLWLEFLGYFISEGHTNFNAFWRKERIRERKYKIKGEQLRNKKTGKFKKSLKEKIIEKKYRAKEKPYEQFCYTVGISQKERNPKIEKCLNKLPWKFARNNKSWTTNNKDLYEELKILGKAKDKYIPSDILSFDKEQLKILYEALMLGDGSVGRCENGSYKRTYYTNSKKLADQFQELCLKIGLATSIYVDNRKGKINSKGYPYNEISYQIRIQDTYKESEYPIPKKIDYEGKIYSVEVPKYHTLFVRRNGKVIWSGNSNWGDNGYFYFNEDYLPFSAWCILVDLPNNWKELLDKGDKPNHYFRTDLWLGNRGPEVVKLQDALKYLGTFPKEQESTGYYGKITQQAVIDFQKRYQIYPQIGYCGLKTRTKLNQLFS